MKHLKDFLLPLVSTIAAILVVVVTWQGNVINQKNLAIAESEALRRPKLVYFMSQISEIGESAYVEQALLELQNNLFRDASRWIDTHPGGGFADALDSVLPISVSMPFSPSGVSINVTIDISKFNVPLWRSCAILEA